jgi:hypothetical protein
MKEVEVAHILNIRFNDKLEKIEFYDAGLAIEDSFSYQLCDKRWTLENFDFKLCKKVFVAYYMLGIFEWYPDTNLAN